MTIHFLIADDRPALVRSVSQSEFPSKIEFLAAKFQSSIKILASNLGINFILKMNFNG
jgi:hypothetical protein